MSTFKSAAAGETEAQFRQFLSYLFQQSTRGTSVTGVLGGAGLSVSQTATPSSSVQVISGAALQQSSLTTGVTPLISNATVTVDVLGPSPMGALPRNDLIVFDTVTASIVAVIGTPNASPTDPTPPNPSVPLARLRNPASATTVVNANIDDIRVFTYLAPAEADSGWVDIPVASGFAAMAGVEKPQVRKIGKRVSVRGGWTSTGMSASGTHTVAAIGAIPVGYRPPINDVGGAGSSTGSAAAVGFVGSDGSIQLRLTSTLGGYYKLDGRTWLVD